MPASDYEAFRRGLEEQLRADVALLVAAYRAKLRAYETVWHARGELDLPAPFALPAVPALDLPALVAAAAAPPPEPAMRPRSPAYAVIEAIEQALARLPAVFDRDDLCRELGSAPSRTTLYRALRDLVEEGVLALDARGSGKHPSRYRKLDA